LTPLHPRYRPELEAEQEAQVRQIVEEAPGEDGPPGSILTKPGDRRQARGVPIVGRLAGDGSMPGTRPDLLYADD
jgi:hypothetical protein